MLPLSYRSINDANKIAAAVESLESVGLGHRIDHLPTQLSGGERQRVAIARALVGNPSVILADEPTGNLDSKTGDEIIDILEQLVEQGQTLIMVTHDATIAKRAKRQLRTLDGRVTEE